MPIAKGFGSSTYKVLCTPLATVPTAGWGAGRQWKMHTQSGESRLQGWGGGQQWKLNCPSS